MKTFAIGDVVRVVGAYGRTDRITDITINRNGIAIYWLRGGGGFSANELCAV